KPRNKMSVNPVWIIPGDTALTRTVGAYSSAAVAVSAATAAFAAAHRAAPALDDQGPPLPEAVEHPREVEADDALPLGYVPLVDLGHVRSPGVVEQRVEAAHP